MTKQELQELFLSRLVNFKFEAALNYIKPELELDEESAELVKWLSDRFGNCGWLLGDFNTLIEAALRSIPGYAEFNKKA